MKFRFSIAALLLLLCVPLQARAEDMGTSTAYVYVQNEGENLDDPLTYLLYDADGKEADRITVEAGGESRFIIETTQPGTVSYTVFQMHGGDSGATYDNTVYCVDVYTTFENGVLLSQPVIYVKDTTEKSEKCRFWNTKPAPEPAEEQEKRPEPVWEVIKTGEEPDTPLWICLAIASVTGIALVFRKMLKEGRE